MYQFKLGLLQRQQQHDNNNNNKTRLNMGKSQFEKSLVLTAILAGKAKRIVEIQIERRSHTLFNTACNKKYLHKSMR